MLLDTHNTKSAWRHAPQVVVNVGGASPPGYGLAYQALLGEPLLSAPDGSSFVTHWMVHAITITPIFCTSCTLSAGNHPNTYIQIMLAALNKYTCYSHGLIEMRPRMNMWDHAVTPQHIVHA